MQSHECEPFQVGDKGISKMKTSYIIEDILQHIVQGYNKLSGLLLYTTVHYSTPSKAYIFRFKEKTADVQILIPFTVYTCIFPPFQKSTCETHFACLFHVENNFTCDNFTYEHLNYYN